MAKGCSICQHPRVQEIDSLLDGGTFKKDVAQQFSVSVHALSRHGRGLCRADALDSEEAKWSDRLEKTYQQASSDGDARAAQQVASTALRHVRQRKSEKLKAAQAVPEERGIFDEKGRLSIGVLSQISDWYETVLSDTQKRTITQAAELESKLGVSNGFALFETMRVDPVLREAVLEFAHNFQLARKEKKENESAMAQASAPN